MEKSSTLQCRDWHGALGEGDLLGGEFTAKERSCKIPLLQTQ